MGKEKEKELPDRSEAPFLGVGIEKERLQQLLKALYLLGSGLALYYFVGLILESILIGPGVLPMILGLLFAPISVILVILGLYRLIRFLFTR